MLMPKDQGARFCLACQRAGNTYQRAMNGVSFKKKSVPAVLASQIFNIYLHTVIFELRSEERKAHLYFQRSRDDFFTFDRLCKKMRTDVPIIRAEWLLSRSLSSSGKMWEEHETLGKELIRHEITLQVTNFPGAER